MLVPSFLPSKNTELTRSTEVDVTTLKMARKPVKLQKENQAGCAGEGKQNEGNQEKRKERYILPIAFCDEITRRKWEALDE